MADNLVTSGFPVAINKTGVATHTIYTPPAGKKWVLFYLVLYATGAVTVEMKSATTAISGVIGIAATTIATFEAAGLPIQKALVVGDAFNITQTGAFDLDGWAWMALVDV